MVPSDGLFLIEFYLIQSSQREGWSRLLPVVLRQLLTVPDALSLLADGWREMDEHGYVYGATEAEVKALLQPFEALLRLSTHSRNGVSQSKGCQMTVTLAA